jgi:hypothetical protein
MSLDRIGGFWLDAGHGIAHPVRVGKFALFTRSGALITSDITIGPGPMEGRGKEAVQMSGLQMDKGSMALEAKM